jgi:prophage antirepressor-like protein
MSINKIAVFQGKGVRKVLVGDEWWFSVIDVVAILTESDNPRDYWHKMKIRDKEESGIELSTICRQLKLAALDGKQRETDCANMEGIFRIIQSIPSPKAEPFKRWLARVGKDRDSIGMPKLTKDAKDGGAVAGRTRKDIESHTGTKIASKENFLPSRKRKNIQHHSI